jgi:glycine/D-amino acid oxidase-like deaminating enzyme
VAVVGALLAAARTHGATVRTGVTAHRLRLRDARVVGVDTSEGPVPADTVVIATGADAPLLCAGLGFALPVVPSPAVLVRLAAPTEVVRTLVSDERIEVRQTGEGTLLVAREHRGETTPAQLRETGEAVLARLRSSFAATADVELLDVRVGVRPMPADGAPVIGPVPGAPGAYLAVMHSGVTLAATVGRLVAAEVAGGSEAAELAALRPARFR